MIYISETIAFGTDFGAPVLRTGWIQQENNNVMLSGQDSGERIGVYAKWLGKLIVKWAQKTFIAWKIFNLGARSLIGQQEIYRATLHIANRVQDMDI